MIVIVVLLVEARFVSDRIGKFLLELHYAPGFVCHVVPGLGVLGKAEKHVTAAFDRGPRDHLHILGAIQRVNLVPVSLSILHYLAVCSRLPLDHSSLVVNCQ